MDNLIDKAGKYLETRLELARLQTVSKSSEVISDLTMGFVISVFVLLFFCSLNIAVALWIGDVLGKIYYGFFIISGFYALIAAVLYLLRKRLIKEPVNNLILHKFLN